MKDLFGKAILDFQTSNDPQNIITETTISEADDMSVAYLFRSYQEMPEIEKKALDLAKGKVLDVGCGAGSHALYLQENGMDVTVIDISENAIAACRLRGLKRLIAVNVMRHDEKYDTILLLMNGAGMCGKLKNLPQFLTKLKHMLTTDGQILLDSSVIIYMFDEDEDGARIVPLTTAYYGEVTFNIRYKNENEDPFHWMYVDFRTLYRVAESVGLRCEIIQDGEHYDYLARLTHG